jgi:hypothetical protein
MGWWSAHLARLRRSLRAMRERDPGCFELGSEIPADDETLATWVAPSVKLALDAIDAKTLANAKPCDAGALEMIDDASARSTRRMFFLSPSIRPSPSIHPSIVLLLSHWSPYDRVGVVNAVP